MTIPANLLVADNHRATREQLVAALTTMGHTATAFPSVLDAISGLGSARVNLILFGFEPGDSMQDLVALARLRELPAAKGAPVILLTSATGGALNRIQMLTSQQDVAAFVPKPCVPSAFRRAVEAALLETHVEASPILERSGKVTKQELDAVYVELGKLDHYARLGVRPDASLSEVKRAFLKRMTRYNPDCLEGVTDPESRRHLRGIGEAMNKALVTLRDPKRREAYDAGLKAPKAAKPSTARPRRERRTAPEPIAPKTQQRTPPAPAAPKYSPMRPPGGLTNPGRSAADLKAPSAEPSAPGDGIQLQSALKEVLGEDAPPTKPSTPGEAWDGIKKQKDTHVMLEEAAHLQAVMGDFAGASTLLEQALKLRPDDQDLRYKLELNTARKFKALGNRVRARRHFQLAIELSPRGHSIAEDELAELEGRPKKGDDPGGGLAGFFGFKKKK